MTTPARWIASTAAARLRAVCTSQAQVACGSRALRLPGFIAEAIVKRRSMRGMVKPATLPRASCTRPCGQAAIVRSSGVPSRTSASSLATRSRAGGWV